MRRNTQPFMTAAQMTAAIQDGTATAQSLLNDCLTRLESKDAPNAITAINPLARSDAKRVDLDTPESNSLRPLQGVPIMVKDNIDISGMVTTAGTVALAENMATEDAAVIHALRRAGAVIAAKTTLHDLAMGITGLSSLHGTTRNAVTHDCVAGGSSGGSAAAVAAGYGPLAIGTDTLGSIRIPAAFHGLYGLRGTAGRGDLQGVVPISPTHDVIGPISRTPIDAALAFDALSSPGMGVRISDQLTSDALRGARLGVLVEAFGKKPTELEVSKLCHAALKLMEKLGATLVPISTPGYLALAMQANLSDYEARPALDAYLRNRRTVALSSMSELVAMNQHHAAIDEKLRARLHAPELGSVEHQRALGQRTALLS